MTRVSYLLFFGGDSLTAGSLSLALSNILGRVHIDAISS